MSPRDMLCANIREYLRREKIDFIEPYCRDCTVFVYVYKSDYYDEEKHDLVCFAMVYNHYLCIRHYDQNCFVCDEREFVRACLEYKNDLGHMGFIKPAKMVYYETSSYYDEYSFPSLKVFAFLNEKASQYLFSRPSSTCACTMSRPEWRLYAPRMTVNLEETGPLLADKMEEVVCGTQLGAHAEVSCPGEKSEPRKLWISSQNREENGIVIFEYNMLARDLSSFPHFDSVWNVAAPPVFNCYENLPFSAYLEDRELCVRLQTVTEGIRFKARNEPYYVWVDMENCRIKFEDSDTWVPFPQLD